MIEVKLGTNLSLPTDAYISRVDGCPCGQASIHLYRGVDTSEHLEVCEELLTFLKGSKLSKKSLKQMNLQQSLLTPEDKKVWITSLQSIASEVHRKQLPLDVPRSSEHSAQWDN